jgi:hypothetical protein
LGGKPIPPPYEKDPYIGALQNNGAIKARFYNGSTDEHDLLWYRHHYDLFVEGAVEKSDWPKFQTRIQDAWFKAEPGKKK